LRNRHTDTIANTEPRGQRSTRLDVIFGLAAPAVDILVKDTGVACFQIGDDEARVWPFRADFDARDDPLDAAPAFGAVVELLEAAELAILGRSLKARLGAGLEALDRRNVVVGATPRM